MAIAWSKIVGAEGYHSGLGIRGYYVVYPDLHSSCERGYGAFLYIEIGESTPPVYDKRARKIGFYSTDALAVSACNSYDRGFKDRSVGRGSNPIKTGKIDAIKRGNNQFIVMGSGYPSIRKGGSFFIGANGAPVSVNSTPHIFASAAEAREVINQFEGRGSNPLTVSKPKKLVHPTKNIICEVGKSDDNRYYYIDIHAPRAKTSQYAAYKNTLSDCVEVANAWGFAGDSLYKTVRTKNKESFAKMQARIKKELGEYIECNTNPIKKAKNYRVTSAFVPERGRVSNPLPKPFTNDQIIKLKSHYDSISPASIGFNTAAGKKLTKYIDGLNFLELKQLAESNIRTISNLAKMALRHSAESDDSFYSSLDTKKKSNPVPEGQISKLRKATRLYEDFRDKKGGDILEFDLPDIGTGLVIGRMVAVEYDTVRGKNRENYRHDFKKSASPLLCASSDGKTLYTADGKFTFTERGIVDNG